MPPDTGSAPKSDAVSPATEALLAELAALRQRAGSPSSHRLAVKIGKRRINPSTIDEAFQVRGTWDKVQMIVAELGGDVDAIHKLWLAGEPGPAPSVSPVKAHEEPVIDEVGEVFRGLFQPRPPAPEIDLRSVAARIREYLEEHGGRFEGHPLPPPPEQPPPLATPTPLPPLLANNHNNHDRRRALIGPASYDSLLSMPVEAAIRNIMTYHPTLARDWGWRS